MGTAGKSYGWIHDYMRAEIEFRKRRRIAERAVRGLSLRRVAQPRRRARRSRQLERAQGAVRTLRADGDNQNERSLELQWDACDTFDCLDRLPTCTVPLHVVGFGQDVQAPPHYGQEVAELAPTGVFHLLPGHGHASLWGPMRSGEVNDLLHEIFSGHDG